VVNQDTGFDEHLPVGEGLFAFRTLAEAIAAFAAIAADPGRHGRAAHALARSQFAPARVLTPLLELAR
jgi:hypothetical protein